MKTERYAMRPAEEDFADVSVSGEWIGDGHTSEELSRSQRNIREWNTYLPQDCVASMIAMGWDTST